uniref:Interleukin 10 receptor, beta n=1 Tax=Cyprinus carpio carpio TaxID=630221 RepID=A0A9J7XIF3_CYPCA
MTKALLPVVDSSSSGRSLRANTEQLQQQNANMKALRCFCVCSLLLLKVSAGFGDLRHPENVSMDSLNTRYVLRWDWPHETAANQTVTFTAQYIREFRSRKANYEKYWTSVCVNVLEHRCDFTGAELHYNGLFLLRVRANTSQQSSGWVQIRFCPDEHAALGPPSSLKLSSVKEDLEIIITDPLSSTNQSMKTLLDKRLSYLIQYWRRSEGPQKAKVLETKNNLVMLTELDRQTWYCVRVQSHDVFHNKSSVFSDTHCTRTEGQMPYWQIFLYVLISLLLCLLLVLLYFCFNKMLSLLKNTFCPAVHLPDHIQELLSSTASLLFSTLVGDHQVSLLSHGCGLDVAPKILNGAQVSRISLQMELNIDFKTFKPRPETRDPELHSTADHVYSRPLKTHWQLKVFM